MNNSEKTRIPQWLSQIRHHPTADFLSNPRPAFGEEVTLRLLAPADAPIRDLILRTIPNGEQAFIRMLPTDLSGDRRWWEVKVAFRERLNPYRFGIVTNESMWWMNAAGISQTIPFNLFDFKVLTDQTHVEWLDRAVFYQIFPDRFCNGDPSNDPKDETIPGTNIIRQTFPWGEAHPYRSDSIPFWGGDLKGVEDHLEYLEELGINAIYFNPIFSGWTNHRYDVIQFDHVDPVLGGDEALISLSDALRTRKMRYILDIVPNHAGRGHPWFRSAVTDPAAVERDFFFFHPETDQPSTWMGSKALIKLNYQSQTLRDRMYLADDSIMRHWLKPPFHADGWRVDVANMLGRHDESQLNAEVISEIRKAVKQTNPQAYLIGENFYQADDQLQGQAWDGVMNYSGFADPLAHWLRPFHTGAIGWEGEIKVAERWRTDSLIKTWSEQLAAIPWVIALQQFNVLDSHDTPRLKTTMAGDENLMRLAAIAQFTFPGVPCLYYGDEIGLSDEPLFGSRNCMPWEESLWDKDVLSFYKTLIALRKTQKPLIEGSMDLLWWDEQVILFQRECQSERVLITLNRGPKVWKSKTLDVPILGSTGKTVYQGLFNHLRLDVEEGRFHIPALTKGGEIWIAVP